MKKSETKPKSAKSARQKQPKEVYIDAGNFEAAVNAPDERSNDEISEEFREAQKFARGSGLIKRKFRETNSDVDPTVAGEDPDADWVEAGTSGDESVAGGNTTPDQADVDVIGEAVGLEYEDNEPLHTPEKIAERDRNRWELDPASSEDYKIRVKRHGK